MPAEWTVRGRHGDRDVRVSWDPGGPGPPLRGPIDVLGAMAGVEGIEAALSPTGPFIEADLERRDGALAAAVIVLGAAGASGPRWDRLMHVPEGAIP